MSDRKNQDRALVAEAMVAEHARKIESHRRVIKNLKEAIMAMSHDIKGGCWCSHGIGDPQFTSHSVRCTTLRNMMKGFTLIEVLITIFVVGVILLAISNALSTTNETRVVACAADLYAMETMTEQLFEQTRPFVPTQNEVYDFIGGKRGSHYHYIQNNSDANSGHGNDLDICDEENPGNSLSLRECLDIKWVWVCDHNHGDLAKYNFTLSQGRTFSIPLREGDEPAFLSDLHWWLDKDPKLQKWIGG